MTNSGLFRFHGTWRSRQCNPNGELLPRPEPQKFQFSRAKVLALLGQYRPHMFKKRGKTAGHTS